MTAIVLPEQSGSCSPRLGSCCGTTCADTMRTRACTVARPPDPAVRARTRTGPRGCDALPGLGRTAVRCGAPRAAPPSLAPI